jgi:hypothetical protein
MNKNRVFENYWIMKYWFPAYISVSIRLKCVTDQGKHMLIVWLGYL